MKERTKPLLRSGLILGCLLGVIFGGCPGSLPATEEALPESGQVVRVVDGDTITIRFAGRIERKVRLIGVDAPEIRDPREDVAFHAFLSRRFAIHHLLRRDVRLSTDFPQLDEYGRVLAYVWLDKEKLFNEFIIRQGFAAAFLKYPFRKDYQGRFRAAEAEARKENRGFWGPDPAPSISLAEVRGRLGEAVSVRFQCQKIADSKLFLFLRSVDGAIEALIPQTRIAAFPGIQGCEGKEIIVTGVLEEFKGRPHIVLFCPRQLRLT
jgi:micrococcal nuclease